jgi:glyoxylase-like metal-dependent hydrolase (beta-lactamase superfamily II)
MSTSQPIIQQFPLGPLETNCYLVGCTVTRNAAFIDPAWDGKTLAEYAAEQGWKITHILLTHAHFDHVGGLAELHASTNAPVYAHADTLPMLQVVSTTAKHWGIELAQPEPPNQLVTEGDVIAVGELRLEVLHTPGHAPGHLSFYLRDANVIFDGDVLFQRSIGRSDFPGSNHADLMRSIRQKLLTLPDETVVLSGHGAQTTIGIERTTNPFLR